MRIIIIGFGSIGKRHHSILQKLLPNAQFYILSNHFNGKLKNTIIYKNIKQIKRIDASIIIVSNTTEKHLNSAISFSNFPTKLFIEKPINNILNKNKFLKLYKKAKKNKCTLYIGYNLRYLDSLNYFFSFIKKSKNIHKIDIEVGSDIKFWRKNIDFKKSVSVNKKYGGGVLLELSHEIDFIIYNLGFPKSVSSYIFNTMKYNIDVEDNAYILMLYNNKFFNFPISFKLDFVRKDTVRKISVFTNKSSLKLDLNKSILYKFDSKNNWNIYKKFEKNISNTYEIMWKKILFSKNNQNNNKDFINYQYNLIKVLENIRESSKNKKFVKFKKENII